MRFAAVLCLWAGMAAATPPDTILSARFTEPTDRYDHGILGDAIEWGALELVVDKCMGCEGVDVRTVVLRLPETRVFEDFEPRIVDVDGDGTMEVMVVETDLALGARLAIYHGSGLYGATPYIGRTHRWLAPIGAADMDGDGYVEIAYIDRPHLARTLRVWRFDDGEMTLIAEATGLTNHKIGEVDIGGGMRVCGTTVEAITANANWSRIIATRLVDGRLISRDVGPHTGRASLTAALAC